MIRAYQERDLDELLVVWDSAARVGHPFLNEAFFEQERKEIAEAHLAKAETWVYEVDGAVAGFIAMIGNEVGGIFVDARLQGRGIGRALMDKVRETRETLELDVFQANVLARQFYEHYGFEQVAEHIHEETGQVQLRLRFCP